MSWPDEPPPIGRHIVRLDQVTSTIDVATRLADERADHGTVVIADRQTAARGRRGRSWVTAPGKSLAATVILRHLPDERHTGLVPIAAALAVVRAIRELLNIDLGTKWPNDVVCGPRKVGGVLAERHHNALLLSLGLNVNGGTEDLPPELAQTATTLEVAHGAPIVRELVVEAVLESLNEVWHTLSYSPDALVGEWEDTDALAGRNVIVAQSDGRRLEGKALGIDDDGRLRLRLRYGEIRHVAMADVTLG